MKRTADRARLSAAAALLSLIPAGQALACASCGCTLSSDWEQMGITSQRGLSTELRYDYLNQNRLWSGTHAISPAEASTVVNSGNPQEVERYTRNQYVTLGLDYNANADWSASLQLPLVLRAHETLGTASDGVTGGAGGGQYQSQTSGLGDVRMLVRYRGLTPEHTLGLLFGLKLPTGAHDLTGQSTDPTAPGPVPIDRGLQPGTGSTDLILGVFHMGAFNRDSDWFIQGTLQTPVSTSDQYRPGTGVNLSAGVRYLGWEHLVPQLQFNARTVSRDSGVNADNVSTGGTLGYLSPGVSAPLGERSSLYAFVQVPVYQNVNGVQLVPRATFSLGLRHAF